MRTDTVDAVVIGGGPNGLVAANALVDAGWEVLLVEANEEIGGAVRSGHIVGDEFVSDLFSAFYPLAAASPVFRDLDLGQHGLEWCHAPMVLAHAMPDGRAAVVSRSVEETAAGLDQFADGDGDAWIAMFEQWQRLRDPLLDALFTPFPPVLPGLKLLRAMDKGESMELVRLGLLSVRRLGEERFSGDGARWLLTGNALHADLPPDSPGSGLFGWLMSMLAQDVGFPAPRGGSGQLSAALAHRFTSLGGEIRTGNAVQRVLLHGRRATGVRLADGTDVGVRNAVLADVTAPALFTDLVGLEHLPDSFTRKLKRFEWDHSTVKVNWALSGPVPWLAEAARGAGTVHLGVDNDGFVDFVADLTVGRVPRKPFVLFGQMTTTDPSRSPEGTESAWAYTHLPQSQSGSTRAVSTVVRRMHDALEKAAPGFRDLVLDTNVQSPADLETANRNLVGGAINGGTSALHQQLVFRPTSGLGRPETPIEGLFLAGASAHPGGGVHGACGWNAARAALHTGGMRRRLLRTAWGRLLPDGD